MKKILAILALIVALFATTTACAELKELDADIVMIRPCFDGTNEVVVSAEDGNLYAYYDDGPVYVGRVHLLIFGEDEVIDVVNYAELNNWFN